MSQVTAVTIQGGRFTDAFCQHVVRAGQRARSQLGCNVQRKIDYQPILPFWDPTATTATSNAVERLVSGTTGLFGTPWQSGLVVQIREGERLSTLASGLINPLGPGATSDHGFTLVNTGSVAFHAPQAPDDSVAPSTAAVISPEANAAGWHRHDVTVALTATDEAGGTGVKEIIFSASGATTLAPAVAAAGAVALPVTAEGVTRPEAVSKGPARLRYRALLAGVITMFR